jgi:hypothetical protein
MLFRGLVVVTVAEPFVTAKVPNRETPLNPADGEYWIFQRRSVELR